MFFVWNLEKKIEVHKTVFWGNKVDKINSTWPLKCEPDLSGAGDFKTYPNYRQSRVYQRSRLLS